MRGFGRNILSNFISIILPVLAQVHATLVAGVKPRKQRLPSAARFIWRCKGEEAGLVSYDMIDLSKYARPPDMHSVFPQPSFSPNPKSTKSPEDRIQDWFIRPLLAFAGEDSVVSLMICLALVEAIVKFRVEEGQGGAGSFSEGSKEIEELSVFLGLSDKDATSAFWDAARNGLLHRGMPKAPPAGKKAITQQLSASKGGIVASLENDTLTIYVWELRDKVVQYLREHGSELWKGNRYPLMDIVPATK